LLHELKGLRAEASVSALEVALARVEPKLSMRNVGEGSKLGEIGTLC
jgi:hypothetical protein